MSETHLAERDRIEAIAADSWYAFGPSTTSVQYLARIFRRHWRGTSCLELGPAEGLMTEQLVDAFDDLTVVEGSTLFCERLADRFPKAAVVNSLFEEYLPDRQFDTIILGHVLEHVADPVGLLRQVRPWLAPGGVLLAAVPNAHSVHRQAAVIMGLLPVEHALNETDVHHGHRRVYTLEGLLDDVSTAGWTVTQTGGYWLKPLSNTQLAEQWTQAMVDAYMELGERYPDSAAEIYVVAEP